MVKKRGVVWNYYDKKINGSRIVASCKFCRTSYNQNATRMELHIQQCSKCPKDIRQHFIELAHNKRHKTHAFDKINNDWRKQESPVEHMVTDMEELDNLNYRNRPYSHEASSTIQKNMNLVIQNNERSSVSRSNTIQKDESTANPANRNWDVNENSTEPAITTADSSEQTSSVRRRKSYTSKKIVQCFSMARYLQSRIFQEKLLEKRALRKVAQLELRHKILELERLCWEYERDKAESEIRWAHETLMMYLKEEHEKQKLIGNKKKYKYYM